MKKLFIFLIIPLVLAGCTKNKTTTDKSDSDSGGTLVVEQSFKDMGTIAMDQGKATTKFTLKNTSQDTVLVKNMETSCMCTTAQIKIGDKISREVGMRGHGYAHNVYFSIEPGDEAEVIAIFDPNAHGPNGTGLNRRSIFLETDLKQSPQIKLDFQANVVRTSAELPDKEVFEFEEQEFDFGLIKQSGGIVKHDFKFTYNGDQDIDIVGVPTSCGCTSAKVSKEKLSKGDEAIIIVSFDPNLHAEPEGKFFKSISLVTEPKVDGLEDIKIWAEIDLDLGPQAYKLQSDHEEEDEHEEPQYNSITPAVFQDMMSNKDFVLIDVHIPEQSHIANTDTFIPYDELENNKDKLPTDKNQKIVVYCRSGSMSRAAAYTLAEMGYNNVYDLSGGKIAFDEYIK